MNFIILKYAQENDLNSSGVPECEEIFIFFIFSKIKILNR